MMSCPPSDSFQKVISVTNDWHKNFYDRIRVRKARLDKRSNDMRKQKEALRNQRVSVFQRGRKIGTVPIHFKPHRIKSKTPLYKPEPGDFTRRMDDGWDVCNSLCPGDLNAIPEFVWDLDEAEELED